MIREDIVSGSSIFSMSRPHPRELWLDAKDFLLRDAVRRYVHELLQDHGHVPRTLSVRILAFKDEAEIFEWNADYRRRLVADYRSPRDHPDLEKVLTATRLGEVIIEVMATTEPLKIATVREGSLAGEESP